MFLRNQLTLEERERDGEGEQTVNNLSKVEKRTNERTINPEQIFDWTEWKEKRII